MDEIKKVLSKELFRVDGYALTVGIVVAVVLVYVMFFNKR